VNDHLVPNWPGECEITPVFAFINEGHGLNVEVHRGVHSHKQEHGHSVKYEPPLDALLSTIGGFEDRRHTLEEQQGE